MIASLAMLACSNGIREDNIIDKRTQITHKMNNEQSTTSPFLIRTYFDDNTTWAGLAEKFTAKNDMGFSANLDLVNDPKNENLSIGEIVKKLPEDYPFDMLFIADSLTLTQSDNTVLCVDVINEQGSFFRVIPAELWSVENNLSIANMDFQDFFENCDENGVFRGFE
ncbi:MAG: DUF6924 domain-containing protein [Fluviicola sp.]